MFVIVGKANKGGLVAAARAISVLISKGGVVTTEVRDIILVLTMTDFAVVFKLLGINILVTIVDGKVVLLGMSMTCRVVMLGFNEILSRNIFDVLGATFVSNKRDDFIRDKVLLTMTANLVVAWVDFIRTGDELFASNVLNSDMALSSTALVRNGLLV